MIYFKKWAINRRICGHALAMTRFHITFFRCEHIENSGRNRSEPPNDFCCGKMSVLLYLVASAGSYRFFVHNNPKLDHNFAKNKNSIFRHFCFSVGPIMALLVHCWWLILLDSTLRWRFATWNGDEHFHFSSKGTLSRQKLQPQMPGRYQTINNEGLKKTIFGNIEKFRANIRNLELEPNNLLDL